MKRYKISFFHNDKTVTTLEPCKWEGSEHSLLHSYWDDKMMGWYGAGTFIPADNVFIVTVEEIE